MKFLNLNGRTLPILLSLFLIAPNCFAGDFPETTQEAEECWDYSKTYGYYECNGGYGIDGDGDGIPDGCTSNGVLAHVLCWEPWILDLTR